MIRRTVCPKTLVLISAIGLFLIGITNIGNTDAFFDKDGSTATRSVDENAAGWAQCRFCFLGKESLF